MVLSRSVFSMVVAGAAVLTRAHLEDYAPNPERVARHASILSESCAAHGKNLLQEGGGTACLLDPETVVGPYGWPSTEIRRDITEDQPGIPMSVKIHVVNSSNCQPITNAAVELWHASWDGIYSHYEEASRSPLTAMGAPTDNTTYLRGVQLLDSTGSVEFDTVVSGWYQSRAWHMHARVLFGIEVAADNSGFTGGTSGHVGQLYVPNGFVHTLGQYAPYNANTIYKIETESDILFNFQGGPFGLMDITLQNPDNFEEGVIGEVTMAVLSESNEEIELVLVPVNRDESSEAADGATTSSAPSAFSNVAGIVLAALAINSLASM